MPLDARTSTSPLTAFTVQAFSADGPLSTLLEGFKPSKEQTGFARQAAETFGTLDILPGHEGLLTFLEGATGTGKTLAYLIPLMIHAADTGERAIVSTHTNHLGAQLIEQDGPLAAEVVRQLTGRHVTIARRIGRRNFIDLDRVDEVLRAMKTENAGEEAVATLQAWQALAPQTFVDAYEQGLVLPTGISETDLCLTPASSNSASEAYFNHIEDSQNADILVTNHALTLIDAKTWNNVLDADRPAKLAVFDEADTLPAVAQSLCETKIPFTTIKQALSDLPSGEPKKQALTLLKTTREAAAAIAKDGARTVGPDDAPVEFIQSVMKLEEALRSVSGLSDDGSVARHIVALCGDLRSWVSAARGNSYEVAVVSASPVRSLPSLVTVARNPARVLNRLWKPNANREAYLRACIFTSATLSNPRRATSKPSFNDMMRELGISGANNFSAALSDAFEPRQFGEMSFVLADRKAPVPFKTEGSDHTMDPQWVSYVAAGIKEARARGGRVMVLAASYADAEIIGQQVPGAIIHTRGDKLTPLLDRYRETPNAVLITPAAWTGVSLPGLVNHLVIPRMPLAPPDHARHALWVRAIGNEAQARAMLKASADATAARKLRQGIGRGIRKHDDVCTTWLLDPRFPLPHSMVRDPRRRLSQGAAVKYTAMVDVIPKRFRSGGRSAFDRAEIWQFYG